MMNTTDNTMHVIYGTGPLGRAVMRALVKRGQQVRMVNRSGQADVPVSVEVVAGDAYDVANVRELTADAAVVYQCAQPAYTEWTEKFLPLQRSIVQGVADNGARLIVAENLYMYGEVDGLVHEGLPYNAHTRKGKVRAQMATELIEAYERGQLQVAMARGSDFYGPYVEGSALGDRVFAPLVQGKKASATGNIDLPHSYTFINDFGEAMAILGENDSALGQAWHVPNPPMLTTRQLIEMAAKQLGVEANVGTMGKLMMRVGGFFIPEAREMVEMMYEFEKPFIVDHSKFEKAFSNIATPHEEALKQTLDWYQQHVAQPSV